MLAPRKAIPHPPPVGIRIRGAGSPPVNRRGFLRAGTPTGAYRRGRPQPLDREVAQLVGVAFASSREFNDFVAIAPFLADNAKLGTRELVSEAHDANGLVVKSMTLF